MRIKKFDYLIIGGGFAGLATAYSLIQKNAGTICIIEKEYKLGQGASSKNASMLCQLVRDPITSELMIDSVDLIKDQWLTKFKSTKFLQCGSLHIGNESDLGQFSDSLKIAQQKNISIHSLSRKEVLAKFPHLDQTDFDMALHCPTDGIIDIESLIQSLTAYCQQNGVTVFKSALAQPNINVSGNFECTLNNSKKISSQYLINAAGAWINQSVQNLQTQNFGSIAMRRHIFVSQDLGCDQSHKPIVWDVSKEIYYRPHGNSLLLSPCDEDEFAPGPTPVDQAAKISLLEKSKNFLPEVKDYKFSRIWSGLRTFAPDKRFVIGWDSECKNLFWTSCLGGYGLTASAAIGELSANLLLGRDVNTDQQIAYSPQRFTKSRDHSTDLELISKDQR